MLETAKGAAILARALKKIPEAAELNEEQKGRLDNALLTISTCLFLLPGTDEDSSERDDLETRMGYAKLTVESLSALTLAKVMAAAEAAVKEVFLSGVAEAVSLLS